MDAPCVDGSILNAGKRRNAYGLPSAAQPEGRRKACSFRVRTDNENLTPWVPFVFNQLRVYSIDAPPLGLSFTSVSHERFPVTLPEGLGQPVYGQGVRNVWGMPWALRQGGRLRWEKLTGEEGGSSGCVVSAAKSRTMRWDGNALMLSIPKGTV